MSLNIKILYQQYYKELLYHLISYVNCHDTAQDLVQESYLVLARTTNKIEHPRGFLYRTASNLALDYLRHQKIIARHQEMGQPNNPVEQFSVENAIDNEQWRALLYQTIAELPSRSRDVLILNKLHGYSYREIARLLSISESAVEKHLVKGLIHCRRHLAKNDYRSINSD